MSGVWPADFDAFYWKGVDKDSAAVQTQITHLQSNNIGVDAKTHGVSTKDLIVSADDVDHAKRVFDKYGLVVVEKAIDADQLKMIRDGVEAGARAILSLDSSGTGNRGANRYSFGSCSKTRHMSHEPAWAQLVDLPTTGPILQSILGKGYLCSGMGGDFTVPGATAYQELHSDYGGSIRTSNGQIEDYRDVPTFWVAVNFLAQDFTPLNGPLRHIFTDPDGKPTPSSKHAIPKLEEESDAYRLSTVLPATAGSCIIRDLRAWHGGTPNVSEEMRAIPNVEYYAEWVASPGVELRPTKLAHGGVGEPPFKPSMPRSVYATLSAEGQRLCQRIVPDEAAPPLELGWKTQLSTPANFAAAEARAAAEATLRKRPREE